MAVTEAQFRVNFPEFTANPPYTTQMIVFWLAVATKQVRACVWQDQVDLGIQLYVAHNCVLEAQAAKAAATGGSPGAATGITNNKSVDKVSVGYDTITAAEADAGNWNLTTYGMRFIHMSRLFGASGIQL